jgi:lipid II:glycine glycyltransferase (peptidoglycan interpeptide bridge formation enzyme)
MSTAIQIPDARRSAHNVVHRFDPLNDSRWDIFVKKHPHASLFHSSAWLQALNRTYSYPAVGYTTSADHEELQDAITFCRVESWLTGRRLVSLPFSDHCEPLVERGDSLRMLLTAVEEDARRDKLRYFEVRPLTSLDTADSANVTTRQYTFHELDLGPDLETLFRNLHKDSIQRKIRRAAREKLQYEEGQSDALLAEFYNLLTVTRRRHNLPPQPKLWFRELIRSFGTDLKIRIARRNGKPVAGMLTLRHKNTLVYKYGGSDAQHHNLGGMHLLYWKSIEDAKASGLQYFDLGRSDDDQDGLITFKSRWGAKQSTLTYSRYVLSKGAGYPLSVSSSKAKSGAGTKLIAYLPNGLVSLLGRALYRHVG